MIRSREFFALEAVFMRVSKFEKQIQHLDQLQVINGAISSLNKLLVDKSLIESQELQQYFESWMKEQGLEKKKLRHRKLL